MWATAGLDLARKRGGLRILPPFGHANSGIYRGRLEALFGAMSFIRHSLSEYVIIADGSLIANMDYEKILAYHEETGADITVVLSKETLNGEIVPDTALLDLDESGRVTGVQLGNQFHGEQNSYLDVCVMKKTCWSGWSAIFPAGTCTPSPGTCSRAA